jgi:hypothetical protein
MSNIIAAAPGRKAEQYNLESRNPLTTHINQFLLHLPLDLSS